MLDSSSVIAEAKTAIRSKNKVHARDILNKFVKENPNNDEAWTLMAYVVGNKKQALACLKRATDINPMNDKAWNLIERLEKQITATSQESQQIPKQDNKVHTPQSTQNKNQKERIIWRGRPSHLNYLLGYIFGLIAIFLAKGSGVLVIAIMLLIRYRRLYTVTNKKVTSQTGIISRKISEVRVKDIRSINLKQSVLERIFKLGTIYIGSAGTAGIEVRIKGIPKAPYVKGKLSTLTNE